MLSASTEPSAFPLQIGTYSIEALLATGGMADIFLARDDEGNPIVIKKIFPHLARQSEFVSMFVDEARFGQLVRHPNVVTIHELAQVGGELFLAMEYLQGSTIGSLLKRMSLRGQRMPYAIAAHIIAEACAGLHAAHTLCDESGKPLHLVHRDVSPQNVFATCDGEIKILDFGIAKAADRLAHTVAGQIKGKYAYMSPEQCRGDALDARSDLFSLGVILYELSTQRRLFQRNTQLLTLEAICTGQIPRPSSLRRDYPPALEEICLRALAHNPSDRFATARALGEALREALPIPRAPAADRLAEIVSLAFPECMSESTDAPCGLPVPGQQNSDLDWSALATTEANLPSDPSATTNRTAEVRRAGRRSRAWPLLLLAVTAAAVGLYWSRGFGASATQPEPRSPRAARASEFAPPAPSAPLAAAYAEAPAAPRSRLATAAESATMRLTIETTPRGAAVFVAGREQGTTPLELTLPVEHAQTEVRVHLPGFAEVKRQVALDRDQTVFVALRRRVAANKRRQSAKVTFPRFD